MKTSIVLRAKIAEAVVDKLLRTLEKSGFKTTFPLAYEVLAEEQADLETTVMQVLGWRKWL